MCLMSRDGNLLTQRQEIRHNQGKERGNCLITLYNISDPSLQFRWRFQFHFHFVSNDDCGEKRVRQCKLNICIN